jgi:exoribonuclease-2
VGLDVPRKNRARTLIENFMVAANTTMATLLSQKGAASIQRVVRSPKRWPRIVAIAAPTW